MMLTYRCLCRVPHGHGYEQWADCVSWAEDFDYRR